ncbi:MAG: sulfatase-like hydrolase/transferase [Planctomycetales bacterium]|nr:sulfatase-like hydrolase/transferase [Planctomycetales bacterium]
MTNLPKPLLFLVVVAVAFTGCDRRPPPVALPPSTAPTVVPPWQQAAAEKRQDGASDAFSGADDATKLVADATRLMDSPTHAPADDEAPAKPPIKARTPLIKGLSELAQSTPLDDEQQNELLDSLAEADQILADVKDENRRAIADLNRQVQLKSENHPHIVLVVANQLARHQLGCYGAERPTTAIDKLAAEGALLRQFYAGGPSVEASFWSLLTGRDTSQAGVGAKHLPEAMTLAEVLWHAGYQTAFVGDWRLPPAGQQRGFDAWFGAAPGQDHLFPEAILSGTATVRVPKNADGQRGQFVDELYVEEALSMLGRRDRSRPLFMIVSLAAPGAASELEVADVADGMAAKLDEAIARIDAELGSQNMRRSTALVVTSHSAPGGGQPACKGALGELYEGGLRVPLVIRWPQRIRAGSVVEEPFGMWDLLPTCARLAEAIRVPRGLDGASALPFLVSSRKAPTPMRRMLYWEQTTPEGKGQAVRMGDWKVVRHPGRSTREDVELYNLAEDPQESRNVADKFPRILEAFLRGSS